MFKTKILTILTLTLLFTNLSAQTTFAGKWKSESDSTEKSFTLEIDEAKHYLWDTTPGRFMTQEDQIWFLDNGPGVGTKWNFKLTKTELTLSEPEDFKYEGHGQYIYFQLTDPKKVIVFKREKVE